MHRVQQAGRPGQQGRLAAQESKAFFDRFKSSPKKRKGVDDADAITNALFCWRLARTVSLAETQFCNSSKARFVLAGFFSG
jgi:hypothetical protein